MTGNLTPKVVLNTVFLIGSGVLIEMNALLIHEMGNAQFDANVFNFTLNILKDLFTRHSPMEVPFTAAVCYSFWRMFRRIVQQAFYSLKWNLYFFKNMDIKKTEYFNSVYRRWNIPFTVVHDKSIIALTSGFLRPQIVLSTGLLELLSADEIKSVLLHERYHCRHWHSLKKFVVQLMIDGMGYIPVMKGLGRYYFIRIELSADQYSMNQMNSSYEIGSALLKLVRLNDVQRAEGMVHFADTGMNYRILQILNPDQPVHVPVVNAKSVFISVIILTLMLFILVNKCPI